MDLFVTGGTGVVGRPLLPLLLDAGHRVRVVTRSEARAATVAAAGGEPVRLERYEVDDLVAAMRGCEAVVDLTTHVPRLTRASSRRSWRQHDWLRDEGTARVVAAAERAGVTRVVRDSVTFLHADGGEDWIDEDWPVEPGRHLASAAAAEQHVAGFAGEGVVLRLALLYGPESEHSTTTASLARRLGLVPVVGPAEAFTASLHTDDAAAAVVAALAVPPGTYDVSDGAPLRRGELVEALREALGLRRLRVPPAFTAQGAVVQSQVRSHRLSAERFRAASGWQPRWRSAAEGWRGLVAAWEEGRGAA